MFIAGEINLTVISMISVILKKENFTEILAQVVGKSSRDVEMLVSRHRPARFQFAVDAEFMKRVK
jgi:hypothetical protein